MTKPKVGEVYWVDFGNGKSRPVMVVSREDASADRALAVCVPLTTEIRGGSCEVKLPRVKWLPGDSDGVANVLGITAIEFHRLERKAGRFDSTVVAAVRQGIARMFDL